MCPRAPKPAARYRALAEYAYDPADTSAAARHHALQWAFAELCKTGIPHVRDRMLVIAQRKGPNAVRLYQDARWISLQWNRTWRHNIGLGGRVVTRPPLDVPPVRRR